MCFMAMTFRLFLFRSSWHASVDEEPYTQMWWIRFTSFMDEVDKYILIPQRKMNLGFLLAIENLLSITSP